MPEPTPLGISRPLRFFHRGELTEVSGLPPTTSVLQWLREQARCSGTKEGCAEGDCGACTVIVAELATPAGASAPSAMAAPAGSAGAASAVVDGLLLRTVNACIQFLPTLDGKALLTVEDLKPIAGGGLHPAQQAMVRCHGSQCGFCTPGFVMTLACAYEHHEAAGTRPARAELADALAGNLCRCTGYRPILDAGEQMFDLPAMRLDTAALKQQLRALEAASAAIGSLVYAGPSATQPPRTPADASGHATTATAHAAPSSAASPPPPTRIAHFYAPRTLAELASLREALPQARLLAGSTDVGLWVTKQFRDLGDLIDLTRVAEIKRIERVRNPSGEMLRIGAGVSLEDAWAALSELAPGLRELWLRFASPPIRHAGTLGGNLANGSPIGDGPPALMALGAELVLRQGSVQRRVALDAFYLDYMRNQLQPGEFIEAIELPVSMPQHVRAYKVSKRYDSDISAVCAAFGLTIEQGQVKLARLAYGGLAATVKRAAQAEAAVLGQPWNAATVAAAQAALARDFQPLSDMRASAGYRLRVAQNLLQRLWLETREQAPLLPQQLNVWDAARALLPAQKELP